MVTCISHSPQETESLAEHWGRQAQSGLVIGLCGGLGAGKTQWVKGLARGLGIAAQVRSPTFALVHIYPGGRLRLFHLDLYRLQTPEQVAGAGLDEFLAPAGVTVIEWAEKLAQGPGMEGCGRSVQRPGTASHPGRWRWVHIETVSETERRISYEDPGD